MRRYGWTWLSVLIVLAAIFLYMGPALTDCTSSILGSPGDSTAGGIWTAFQYGELSGGPWRTGTPYLNAPVGEEFQNPHLVTAQVLFLPLFGLSHVIGPVCSWNALVVVGFLSAAAAMYGFIRWLTASEGAALFGALAFTFSPYRLMKAEGHLAYLFSAGLVLLIWALIAFWMQPSRSRILAVAGSLALLAYTDGYYILLGGVAMTGFIPAVAIATLVGGRRSALITRLVGLLAAGGISLLLCLPIGITLLRSGSEISQTVTRQEAELTTYSARLQEYLIPARKHPVLSKVFGSYQDRHLHGSNYSEQTLYLGWTVLGLAFIGVIRSRRLDELPEASKLCVPILATLTLIALVFSAPPSIHLPAGVTLPMPSRAIFSVAEFWRVYARFFLLVHAALVPLAAVGLAYVLRSATIKRRGWIVAGVTAVLAMEFVTVPTRWSYAKAPQEYKWLEARSEIETIAEYPFWLPPSDQAYAYKTWQVLHKKRLLNSGYADGPRQPLRMGVFGLANPQSVPVLRRLGIDAVVVHAEEIEFPLEEEPPPGLEPQARFGKTQIFRVLQGSPYDVALGVGDGFHFPGPRGWGSIHWMKTEGELHIYRLAGSHARAEVRLVAESPGPPRSLVIRQDGRVIWNGDVSDPQRIQFEALIGRPIVLTTSPQAMRASETDPRPISVGISELDVASAQ